MRSTRVYKQYTRYALTNILIKICVSPHYLTQSLMHSHTHTHTRTHT